MLVADLGPPGSEESGSGSLVRLTMVGLMVPPGPPIFLDIVDEFLAGPGGVEIPVAAVNNGEVWIDAPCP